MPKDFMCSRITDNSPLRFLDYHAGIAISKYRLSIPYILQTIMDEAMCRRRGRKKEGKKKHWELVPSISWKEFAMCCRLMDQSLIFRNHDRRSYGGIEHDTRISTNHIPCIKVDFGTGKKSVPIDQQVICGGHNFLPQMVRQQREKIKNQLARYKYPLAEGQSHIAIRNTTYEDKMCDHHIPRAVMAFYDYHKTSRLYDEYENKRRNAFMKKHNVGMFWQVPDNERWMLNETMLFPKTPNIYQRKCEILEKFQIEYGLNKTEMKKLSNKYTIKQLINIYWKELLDML